ncbi:hypothetical protein SLEP1_g53316 [Rubroshorea leprosula]|uniref:NB-ARC domain-containing protein n=1 Tax=Rubroshorea leprosula TaxID=152421 RepID=A0AAV5MBW2_9ROSI|nr:hypothetical protein SLEP1_g53316 [Rubroshorea leprosula]
MEDVLDGFRADVQRSTVMAKPHQGCTSEFTLKCFPCFKPNDFVFDSDTISKVKLIAERLQKMIKRSQTLSLVSSTMQAGEKLDRAATRPVTTTPQPESQVYGRKDDKEAILQKLLNGEGGSEAYCVLPIVGMGGIGKTTLARQVYGAAEQKNFQRKAWVCVSDQFEVKSITKNILIELTKGGCDLQNLTLNLLQEKLKEQLSNKKFLLVLDDVWNEDCNRWDNLKVPFKSGAPGSTIIVTTRNEHVAEIMGGKDSIYQLKVLEDDKCLSILAQEALGVENFDAHPGLKDVGQEMVKMCKGLPLAAKMLGGLLRALMLSYHHLPSHLKQCFSYCAIFPKDHQFNKEELIFLWMAEGLLQKHPGEENQTEDIGHQYFSELLSRSFFQHSSNDESRYVMHDLIHDLAQYIAGETCCNLENILEAKKEGLRAFVPINSSPFTNNLSITVMHDWLVKLTCLRALSLRSYNIRKLPDSIGDLKCLRYLNLSKTAIETLPESIGFLLSLQTLLLQNCAKFSKFPATIGNLNDLRYLDITNTPSLIDMPHEIANLKNLLILPKFIVRKTNGLRLSDVKNLLHLRGYLSFLDLQNVSDNLDAMQSNIHMIEALDELKLNWTADFDDSRKGSDIEAEVLSSLRPHPNLKKLTISCYGGKRFPSWIGDQFFCHLFYLRLSGCRNSTLLPSVGQLPALRELIIKGMDAIETVDSEFYGHGAFTSLQILKFHSMLNWEKWAFLTSTGVEFSCLKDLEIANCPKLMGNLPSNLSSLTNLVIRGCPELTCSSLSLPCLEKLCIAGCKQVLLESMVNLTSLTMLKISDILGLGCLPKSFTDSLTALENIEIERCQELTYLWEEGADTSNLAHLERMEIEECPLLVSISWGEQGLMPPNVKYLSLYNCGALKCLPDVMMMRADGSNNMVRLEELRIEDCPCLERFPRGKLPATCQLLKIGGCAKVESLPKGILVQEDDGDDSNNIENLKVIRLSSLNFIPSDDRLPAALKKFKIENCLRLESISERMLQHCTRLETMDICNCVNLKSLSFDGLSNLTFLSIAGCDALESFQEMPKLSLSIPNIKFFNICDCQNLKSLPNKMDNLTSLQGLIINGCPGIKSIPEGGLPPSLTHLSISCENLKQPMREWGLHTLTSLGHFSIGHLCPPKNVLPSSLTILRIYAVQNLKSIPRGLLQNLNSLTLLGIWRCPKLQSLPREGLPPLLGELDIHDCPLLKRKRFQEKGKYWPLIAHIPRVVITYRECSSLIGHPNIFYLQQLRVDLIAFKRVQHFDNAYQYPLFVAAPYEIITFEISSTEIDKSTPKFFSDWDPDFKMFMLAPTGLFQKSKPPRANKHLPVPAATGKAVSAAPLRSLLPPSSTTSTFMTTIAKSSLSHTTSSF